MGEGRRRRKAVPASSNAELILTRMTTAAISLSLATMFL
ncbi:hypothetical protein Rleg10DRAFT_1566 [Rhizobium leguminosarum bv. trifolii WSM2012]|nr:hypothetical protein Rleg10DRAFT_1566 [Rhizobium leguminosarum bv. trifolii WSM2012]